MSPERRREVAASGGRTAQAQGVGHQFTSAEARLAGIKGGKTRAEKEAARRKLGGVEL
jgi:hypothetical protein